MFFLTIGSWMQVSTAALTFDYNDQTIDAMYWGLEHVSIELYFHIVRDLLETNELMF